MKKLIITSLAFVIALSSVLNLIPVNSAEAADARTFNAGRIIDDGVFTNSDSMSVANIQSFLNSKVPNCDTYGTKMSELGGGTRAQFLASRGISVPITCLKDYHENPSTGENNYGKAIPAGGLSAAQLIYNYSRQFSINPQVLIVTLQKENGLITDEWPTPKQYSESMGFGCPDNVAPGAPACNPSYGSFSAQLYQAARHFRGYINNAPGWWVPFTTGNNTIRWSPNTACGSSVVNIQNRATVALYSYTPYQPNEAAKNAQYGTGDGCSAYGNRNFFMYFTDWFGSTFGGDPVSTELRITSPITMSPTQPIPGQPTTISYTVRNFSTQPITYETSLIQCRLNVTSNCDSPYTAPATLTSGESRVFNQTITLPAGGNYSLTPFFLRGGIWNRFGTQDSGTNSLKTTVSDMRITSPITFNPTKPRAGEFTVASFVIKNFGSNTVNLQTSVLQCRYDTSINCDSANGGSVALPSGASLPVSYGFTPAGGGVQTLIPFYMEGGNWYRYNTFESISTSTTIDTPDVRLTGQITASPSNPIPDQATTISYTVRNFGTSPVVYEGTLLQCRFNTHTVCDTPFSAPVTLQVGEQRTFNHSVTTSKAGEYKFVPYALKTGSWYKYSNGVATTNELSVSVPKYVADLRLTSAITTNPVNPIPGQAASVSYTVKNFGTSPAIYQESILQCRKNTSVNCDGIYLGAVTIPAGDSRTFTESIEIPTSGSYVFKPFFMQNDEWHLYNASQFVNQKILTVDAYVADLRLTTPISISPAQPTVGQSSTVTYTVRNFGTLPAIYQDSVLQCRRNTTINCDSTYSGVFTIAPGDSKVFTHTISITGSGSHIFVPYFMQNSTWYKYNQGTAPSNQFVISL